jgi:hypothetical protein
MLEYGIAFNGCHGVVAKWQSLKIGHHVDARICFQINRDETLPA